jgi:DNA-binding transcriptional LysR family regulator
VVRQLSVTSHPPADKEGAAPVGRRAHLHASVLRYLAEVARAGSIRRASMTLNVAPSAIDRQVLRIEADLGIRIFDRMPTGMRLTPAGELLLRHVRSTLQHFDRLLTDIDGLQGIHSGHVNLAALDSLLVDVVPSALAEVAARYPAVSFSAIAASPAAVLAGIEAGEMELGLTFVVPTGPGLELVASTPAPLGCVMAPCHVLAKRASLAFADLDGHAVTLQSEPLPAMSDAADELAAFRSRARARFISNSIEFQRHILHTGLAVACLTRLGFQREIASDELVWVPLASPSLRRLEIGLFVPSQRTLSPAATQVVRTITSTLQKLRDGH